MGSPERLAVEQTLPDIIPFALARRHWPEDGLRPGKRAPLLGMESQPDVLGGCPSVRVGYISSKFGLSAEP